MRLSLPSWKAFFQSLGLRPKLPRPKTTGQLKREATIPLAFEQLEPRHMMAGDILAVVTDGQMFLKGDELPNHVIIDQSGLAPDEFRVSSGTDKTTINGQDGPLVLNGVTGDIRIALKGGNDSLTVQGITTTRDLRLDGGDGDNSFDIQNTTVARNLNIRNRDGLDQISIHNSSVQHNLTIRNGDGGSQIHVGDTSVEGHVRIKNRHGSDDLEIHEVVTVGHDLVIKNGNGGSETQISDSQVAGRLRIKTRRGEDHVALNNAEVQGRSCIRLGDDDDLVSIKGSHFAGKFRANGGRGHDEFHDEADNEFLLGAPKLKHFEVLPDHSLPVIGFDPSSLTVDEVTGTVSLTVKLTDTEMHAPVTVHYATIDSTAVAGQDYTEVSGDLSFAPGHRQQTITVPIINDDLPEVAESFALVLSAPVNATLSTPTATVTIQDDDPQATLGINISDAAVNESAGTAEFVVSLSSASSQAVSVAFATANGSAAAGQDYTSASGILTFDPGETTKTIPVAILNDTLAESVEDFRVNLSNATGGATIADSEGVGTVQDDDASGAQPSISINDVTLSESAGTFDFTVTLSGTTTEAVSVSYQTIEHTALSGVDFTAISNGLITFAPGETQKTISISVADDDLFDPSEHFHVRLSNPMNATIADAEGDGNILDDEAPPGSTVVGFDPASVTVSEGAGTAQLTITLSGAETTQTVTVSFATTEHTATAGFDYTTTQVNLTFLPGERIKTVNVPILEDSIVDDGEHLHGILFNIVNATPGQTSALLTITDND